MSGGKPPGNSIFYKMIAASPRILPRGGGRHFYREADIRTLEPFMWISLGAILGANLRYLTGRWMAHWLGTGFPFGTMVANVAGCFLAGLFGALIASKLFARPDVVRQFVYIGFLGSLTTFSSFTFETLALSQDGLWTRALVNVLVSLVAGFAGVRLGALAAMQLGILR